MPFAAALNFTGKLCVLTIFNSKNGGPVLLFKTLFRH